MTTWLLSSPGLNPGQGHCGLFSGKTLSSHIASLYADVQIGTSEFNAGGSPVWTSVPSGGGGGGGGGVETLVVASCYGNST